MSLYPTACPLTGTGLPGARSCSLTRSPFGIIVKLSCSLTGPREWSSRSRSCGDRCKRPLGLQEGEVAPRAEARTSAEDKRLSHASLTIVEPSLRVELAGVLLSKPGLA